MEELIEQYEQQNKIAWDKITEIPDVEIRAFEMARLIGNMTSQLWIIKTDIQCLSDQT